MMKIMNFGGKSSYLEFLASFLQRLNLGEQENLLKLVFGQSFAETYKYEIVLEEEAETLSEEDPDRFKAIGLEIHEEKKEFSRLCGDTIGVDTDMRQITDEDAIGSAKYLYRRFPIIFQFYDELIKERKKNNPSILTKKK